MENIEIAKKRQLVLDLIWFHSATPDQVEEAFHDYTNSLRFEENSECAKLREENHRLRAAVLEMKRMLPVINEFEDHRPVTWDEVTNGTGISTANAYRQTLEAALEKIK